MEKLTKITLGGVVYPIKFDYLVLKEVQKEFGTIVDFEKSLIGLTETTDEQGNKAIVKTEPSIEVISFVLPIMINEGLEIEADEKNKEFVYIEEKEILRKIDIPFRELSVIIHEELKKCFITKKQLPKRTTTKNQNR